VTLENRFHSGSGLERVDVLGVVLFVIVRITLTISERNALKDAVWGLPVRAVREYQP
jgi:hypothetical protein